MIDPSSAATALLQKLLAGPDIEKESGILCEQSSYQHTPQPTKTMNDENVQGFF